MPTAEGHRLFCALHRWLWPAIPINYPPTSFFEASLIPEEEDEEN